MANNDCSQSTFERLLEQVYDRINLRNSISKLGPKDIKIVQQYVNNLLAARAQQAQEYPGQRFYHKYNPNIKRAEEDFFNQPRAHKAMEELETLPR